MSVTANVFINLLLIAAIGHFAYSRKIYAYFETLECPYHNADYMETIRCWLEPDQNGQFMMSAEFTLKQDLNDLHSKFQFIVEQNKRNLTYLSMDIDMCAAFGAAVSNPILRLTADELHRKTNLQLDCPLKKAIKYSMYNFSIDSKYIPSFAPKLRFISDSLFYTTVSTDIHKIARFINTGRVDHKPRPKKVNKV